MRLLRIGLMGVGVGLLSTVLCPAAASEQDSVVGKYIRNVELTKESIDEVVLGLMRQQQFVLVDSSLSESEKQAKYDAIQASIDPLVWSNQAVRDRPMTVELHEDNTLTRTQEYVDLQMKQQTGILTGTWELVGDQITLHIDDLKPMQCSVDGPRLHCDEVGFTSVYDKAGLDGTIPAVSDPTATTDSVAAHAIPGNYTIDQAKMMALYDEWLTAADTMISASALVPGLSDADKAGIASAAAARAETLRKNKELVSKMNSTLLLREDGTAESTVKFTEPIQTEKSTTGSWHSEDDGIRIVLGESVPGMFCSQKDGVLYCGVEEGSKVLGIYTKTD